MRPPIMRPLLLLPAFALPAGSAAAQAMPYPPPDTAPITSVKASAPVKPLRVRAAEAHEISGGYEMSNGWYLRVRTAAHHIDAIIDNQPSLRLAEVAPYRFVSGDGNVTMDFKRGSDGEDMRMSYVPDLRPGQRVVLESRMAQR